MRGKFREIEDTRCCHERDETVNVVYQSGRYFFVGALQQHTNTLRGQNAELLDFTSRWNTHGPNRASEVAAVCDNECFCIFLM